MFKSYILNLPKTGIIIILIYLIIGIGFVHNQSIMFGNQSSKLLMLLGVLPFLLLLGSAKIITKPLHIKITWLDLALAFYFLYLVFSRFFISEIHSLSIPFLELISIAILYVILRMLDNNAYQILLFIIMISGGLQAIYGILQVFGYYPSLHPMFGISGGFFNPGPYSGYLVSTLPVALCFIICKPTIFSSELSLSRLLKRIGVESIVVNRNTHFVKISNIIKLVFKQWIPFLCTMTLLVALPATQSRAAWLAVVGSLIWLFAFTLFPVKTALNYIPDNLTKVILFAIVLLVIFIGIGTGIYLFKKDSADGRMLIWKVSSTMIKDAPFVGHGCEKFKGVYMTYQARYLSVGKGRTLHNASSLADDNQYAFNDPLKVLVETGIIGLLLLVVIVVVLFRHSSKTADQTDMQWYLMLAAKAAIISIAIFSMFSYPSEILPIKVNLILYLSILAGANNCTVVNISNARINPLLLLIFAVCMCTVSYGVLHTRGMISSGMINWQKAFNLYNMGNYEKANQQYKMVYPYFSEDGKFLVNYGKSLSVAGDHTTAVDVLTKAAVYSNNSIVQTAMGDSYKALGKYRNAEKAYLNAHFMVPGRFYPMYLLSKLYQETGELEKAMDIAEQLLNKDVKIPSTAIIQIQEEMRKLIARDK
jgi:O-antigen polymerase